MTAGQTINTNDISVDLSLSNYTLSDHQGSALRDVSLSTCNYTCSDQGSALSSESSFRGLISFRDVSLSTCNYSCSDHQESALSSERSLRGMDSVRDTSLSICNYTCSDHEGSLGLIGDDLVSLLADIDYPLSSSPCDDTLDQAFVAAISEVTVWDSVNVSNLGSFISSADMSPSSGELHLSVLLPPRPDTVGKEASPACYCQHHSSRTGSMESETSSFTEKPQCTPSVTAGKLHKKSIKRKMKTIQRSIKRCRVNSMYLETLAVLWIQTSNE